MKIIEYKLQDCRVFDEAVLFCIDTVNKNMLS